MDVATPPSTVGTAAGYDSVNTNLGTGQQVNNSISGGSHNTQYNATNQYFQGAVVAEDSLDQQFRATICLSCPPIDRANLIDAKGKRVPETCEWIRTTKEYTSWHDEDVEQLLWIWGEPSKGKTMLSIFLSQELEKEAETIYFFCSADDEKRNTAVAVLRGLLWHLTDLCPRLTRAFRKSFESNIAAALSSRETLWTAFTELIGAVDRGRLYCVIDGLDECDESSRQWLSSKLISLASTGNASRVKLAISSRKLFELRESLQMKLDTDYSANVDWAVEAFLEVRSKELFDRITPSDEHRAHIKAILLDKAEGTYLWIAFAMIELLKQETIGRVLGLLEEMPAGLAPYYNRMIRSMIRGIDARRRETSLRLLGCITFASRPLGFMELASIIECTPPKGITPCEHIRDLIVDCRPLFHVTEHVDLGTVSLIHESVRDFVNRGNFPDGIDVSSEETHLCIARACLDALESHDSPLLEYAEIFWPHHARMSGMRAKELLTHRSSFFNKNSTLRNEWWEKRLDAQHFSHFDYSSEYLTLRRLHDRLGVELQYCSDLSRLHVACSLGIEPWVHDILEKHHSWLSKRFYLLRRDTKKHTPLIHAVVEGHTQTVDALLRYTSAARTLVNDSGGVRLKPLLLAARYDRLEIARLLLDHKADVNARESIDETALHIARSAEMTRLLLEHGADVNARNKSQDTALHSALDAAMIRVLLEHGADANAKNSHQDTALHSARDAAMTRVLLEHGADANVRNKWGQTALHQTRSEATARVLIEHGVDIDARDVSRGKTALHGAANLCQSAMVKLLLEHGADANARSTPGKTALHYAISNNEGDRENELTIKLLLDNGADVNAKDQERHWIALHAAALKGLSAVVKLLLDNGADVNAIDQEYHQTALHKAAMTGQLATVKLLLEAGADTNVKDRKGDTALLSAIDKGRSFLGPTYRYRHRLKISRAIVRALVQYGAEFDADSDKGKLVLRIVHEVDW